jgi:hypothetical protein
MTFLSPELFLYDKPYSRGRIQGYLHSTAVPAYPSISETTLQLNGFGKEDGLYPPVYVPGVMSPSIYSPSKWYPPEEWYPPSEVEGGIFLLAKH